MLRSFRILSIAAASALIVLAATFTASAADNNHTNFGPVGPHEPILATVGTFRLVAYYEPDNGKCAVSAVVFDATPNGGGKASTRVRLALHPGELFHLDGVKDAQVVLTCGPNAKSLTVLNPGEILTKSASKSIY